MQNPPVQGAQGKRFHLQGDSLVGTDLRKPLSRPRPRRHQDLRTSFPAWFPLPWGSRLMCERVCAESRTGKAARIAACWSQPCSCLLSQGWSTVVCIWLSSKLQPGRRSPLDTAPPGEAHVSWTRVKSLPGWIQSSCCGSKSARCSAFLISGSHPLASLLHYLMIFPVAWMVKMW